MSLYNGSEKISASEINRFTYCPYQWYYERAFGKKHITILRKELIKSLGLTNTSESNFVKGQKFHENYKIDVDNKDNSFLGVFLWLLILIAFIAYILYFL